jgi:5S rRNA maturation endonuclease (ribonuclease M5)
MLEKRIEKGYYPKPIEKRVGESKTEETKNKITKKEIIYDIISFSQEQKPQPFAIIRGYKIDVLEDLGIGWLNKMAIQKLEKRYTCSRLKKMGFAGFYERIIIPFTEDYFVGRVLTKFVKKKKNLFLKGRKKQFWYVKSKTKEPEGLILVEGETDLITARHLFEDYDLLSVGGCQSNIVNEIHKFLRTNKVYVCYDKDSSGFEGSNKVIKAINEYGLSCKRITWDGNYKDLDELRKEFGSIVSKEKIKFEDAICKDIFIKSDFKPISKEETKEIIIKRFPGC